MYSIFAPYYEKHVDFDFLEMLQFVKHFEKISGKNVVEVGCGSGRFSELLAKEANFVLGIDPSESMLELAIHHRQHPNISYVIGSAEDIPTNNTFDIVCAINDLVNYLDPEGLDLFIDELKRITKEGSIVVLDFSNSYKIREILGNETYFMSDEAHDLVWINEYSEEKKAVDIELILYTKEGEMYRKEQEFQRQYDHQVDILSAKLKQAGFQRLDLKRTELRIRGIWVR